MRQLASIFGYLSFAAGIVVFATLVQSGFIYAISALLSGVVSFWFFWWMEQVLLKMEQIHTSLEKLNRETL